MESDLMDAILDAFEEGRLCQPEDLLAAYKSIQGLQRQGQILRWTARVVAFFRAVRQARQTLSGAELPVIQAPTCTPLGVELPVQAPRQTPSGAELPVQAPPERPVQSEGSCVQQTVEDDAVPRSRWGGVMDVDARMDARMDAIFDAFEQGRLCQPEDLLAAYKSLQELLHQGHTLRWTTRVVAFFRAVRQARQTLSGAELTVQAPTCTPRGVELPVQAPRQTPSGVELPVQAPPERPAQPEGSCVQQTAEDDAEPAVPRGGEVFDVEASPLLSVPKVVFVFVDIETSSFYNHGEILQLAAKCEGSVGEDIFNVYCKPTGRIDFEASFNNKLEMIEGELCYRKKKVECTPRHEMLSKFLHFLYSFGSPVVLVAHKAPFDLRYIIKSFADYFMLRELTSVVVGVCDTLHVFKANERAKQEHCFELTQLAQVFLPKYDPEMAHEAVSDCRNLEQLCAALRVSREHFFEKTVPFSSMVHRQVELQNKRKFSPGLKCLRARDVSQGMIDKMAQQAFTIERLAELYSEGESRLISVLREKVTKRGAIIEGIVRQLKSVLFPEKEVIEVEG